jgi:hypothetical protein
MADVCDHCDAPLGTALKNLLQMQTVVTRRRERISADEEERNRVGFELVTSYRFVPRGGRVGHYDATALAGPDVVAAALSYGDAAEIRVTNLGRRRRKNPNLHGFWLDLVQGRWLTEAQAAHNDGGDDDADDLEAGAQDVKRKDLVIPFVEDRRNVLVLRWAEQVHDDEAVTLQYAVERGVEAIFQLEDTELISERLPDADQRGRTLFVEAAEGGAGVLRRLQAEPDALARAAREALRIIHVDPDTGDENENACVRGCYRCLLSYSNQTVHAMIDRRRVVERLRRLAQCQVRPTPTDRQPATTLGDGFVDATLSDRAQELLRLLAVRKLRHPSETATTTASYAAPIDLVFYRDGMRTAVVLDDPHTGERPDPVDLVFAGWNVIHIRVEDDLDTVVSTNPAVFGQEVR